MSRAAKGADCKSAGYAFVGSSPTSPTTFKIKYLTGVIVPAASGFLLHLLHNISKHFQRVPTSDGNSTQQRCNKIRNLVCEDFGGRVRHGKVSASMEVAASPLVTAIAGVTVGGGAMPQFPGMNWSKLNRVDAGGAGNKFLKRIANR